MFQIHVKELEKLKSLRR